MDQHTAGPFVLRQILDITLQQMIPDRPDKDNKAPRIKQLENLLPKQYSTKAVREKLQQLHTETQEQLFELIKNELDTEVALSKTLTQIQKNAPFDISKQNHAEKELYSYRNSVIRQSYEIEDKHFNEIYEIVNTTVTHVKRREIKGMKREVRLM